MNILKLILGPFIDRMIFTKKNILKSKKETVLGMIMDKEIEIEVNWLLLRVAEKDLDKTQEKIRENWELIEEERSKSKGMDLEKIKKLTGENVFLGFEKVDDDGIVFFQSYTSKNPKRRKRTEVGKFENRIESQKAGITQAVFKREMLKNNLRAVNKMIKGGFEKDFEKFRDESLDFVLKA